MNTKQFFSSVFILLLSIGSLFAQQQSWTADNGNGSYTNPLFYDEFSDPDLIRVGDDFYLTGTTMHSMPGLPILHSKDLVNWKIISYAFDKLDMGPAFRLENGEEVYGQGIWAPCIRYNNGTFYIFSNINGYGMQVFTAKNPQGPWTRKPMNVQIHDLSVLFDDDGKIYAVYGYGEVKLVELKPDMSGIVEGTDKVIIPQGNAMGEGHHMYKIDGKYFIISADYSPVGRMQCARADKPYGPYETVVISAGETMGTQKHFWSNVGMNPVPAPGSKFEIWERQGENEFGAVPLHQGGIVQLPNGDWWGWSMMDFLAVGRTTFLSPVTWQDGWPYFGLAGNLGRSPRTWVKPNMGIKTNPSAPYQRSDDFSGPTLQKVWQWNHEPVNKKWKLDKKSGTLRLHTLPAKDFLWAKNTLTQRCIGPVSLATTELDASNLKPDDIAGLALLNIPYAALGVIRKDDGLHLRFYDQFLDKTIDKKLNNKKVKLRVTGNYDKGIARFSYSLDGSSFVEIGDTVQLPYQVKTFQGSRYALFAYNTNNKEGGYASFTDFTVSEPLADRSKNIPTGKIITLTNIANNRPAWARPKGMLHWTWPDSEESKSQECQFKVHDRGNGQVVLEALNGTGFLTVVGAGLSGDVRLMKEETEASLFQWQDMLNNQCMLLSLKTNRYVGLMPDTGEPYSANSPGTRPDRKDGSVFLWQIADDNGKASGN